MPTPKTSLASVAPARTVIQPAPQVPYSVLSVVRAASMDAELFSDGQAAREQKASQIIANSVVQPTGGMLRGGTFLPVGREARSLTSAGFLATSLNSLHQALRPALRLNDLGAQLLDLSGNREVLAAGVPAAAGGGFATENGDAVESIATISGCSLAAADAFTRMTVSRRLLRSPAAEATLLDLTRRTLAATIERGVLAGTGADGQPLGLLTAPALQQKIQAGAVLTLTEAAEAVEQVLLADGDLESTAFLMAAADFSPLVANVFAGQTNIVPDAPSAYNLAGRPVHFSKFIPSGRWICADWSQLTIGYWGPPELIVDKVTLSARGTTAVTLWQTVASGVANRETFVIGKAA